MAIHVLKVGMLLKITFTTRILSLSSPKTGSRVAEIKFASSSCVKKTLGEGEEEDLIEDLQYTVKTLGLSSIYGND